MKKTVLTLCAVLIAAGSLVHAQALVEDTDGSGGYSMDEMLTVFPDLTAEEFDEIDADGDGEVSPVELVDAIEAEVIAK